MVRRLLPVESWCVERDAAPNPWHVTDVTVLAGDDLTAAEVRARVAERIASVPRWRQRVATTGLGEVWADDPGFDVAAHVRDLPLPAGATIAQLQDRVAELLHEPLPRSGPRWEIAVVRSLRGRRSALVTRVNPAWVDGVDGVHLLSELLDDAPVGDEPVPYAWEPEPSPAADDVVTQLVDAARDPLPALTGAALQAGKLARWGLQQTGVLPIARQPRYLAGTGVPLDLLRRISRRTGARVHDAIVASVAGGLRRIGERVDPVAVVPQAVRDGDVASALGMGVRADMMVLPVRIASADGRLEQIATMTQARVDAGGLVGASEIASAFGTLPPSLHTVAARLAAMTTADVVIANVPGPQEPRYLGERLVKATYPVLSQTGNQKITVGVTCYAGQVLYGITGIKPVADLADAMLAELHALAED